MYWCVLWSYLWGLVNVAGAVSSQDPSRALSAVTVLLFWGEGMRRGLKSGEAAATETDTALARTRRRVEWEMIYNGSGRKKSRAQSGTGSEQSLQPNRILRRRDDAHSGVHTGASALGAASVASGSGFRNRRQITAAAVLMRLDGFLLWIYECNTTDSVAGCVCTVSSIGDVIRQTQPGS